MNASTKLLLLLLLTVLAIEGAHGQASSFTYQGQLRQSGEPFTGMADLEFRLYDQLSDGTQIGGAQSLDDVPVEDGLFQVELDFGATAFDGSDRFLEVTVDGAALIPRQKVTATPYALLATGLASGSVGGGSIDPTEVQLRVVGTCPAGEYVQQINQDGSVVCGVDDAGMAGWSLTGNAGTNASTNFIGTTDAVAFEIRTADVRSLRIEPSAETFGGSPITTNTIAGASANVVLPGVRGATISGGGVPSGDSDPELSLEAPNRITDHYGTIGGGYANVAGDDSAGVADRPYATVGGGFDNIASGFSATVGGGSNNTASSSNTTVGGGNQNTASGSFSTVGGGFNNNTAGGSSTVSGGTNNTASGSLATVGGGNTNTASSSNATVGGGSNNTASGNLATVGGGFVNTASGFRATIGGGEANTASGSRATVGGGDSNTASGNFATVGGGTDNTASGDYSFVVGRRAKNSDASHDGVFIFADSGNADFTSTGANQFIVRAAGGVAFGRAPDDYFEIQTPFNEVNGNGSGERGAFRVRLNGTTRLRLLGNGGLAVGNSWQSAGVPDNGIRVAGEVQLGIVNGGGSAQLCLNSSNRISTCSSSARYKSDIAPLDLGLDEVLALRPVGYRWTSDGKADIGFVAEEVAEIDERLIDRNDEGQVDGVRYDRISAVLANAVRTLDEQREESNKERQALRAENKALRAQIAEAEEGFETRLAAVEDRQAQELTALRHELALLRELVAPRVAQEVN